MPAGDLRARQIEALKASEYWTSGKTRDNGRTISPLKCPECGQTKAWAYSAAPNAINCNRANQCGAVIKLSELFPDLYQKIEKDFPPTKKDPNRPAAKYLESRGLSKSFEGLHYEYWKDVRGTGSGAVMFPVGEPGKKPYNGRLISPPPGEGKTHNWGSTGGRFWKHPGREYDLEEETFITEAIINSLSLDEMGLQSIAVLSAGQDPGNLNLSEFKKLTAAFDNDAAGWRALRKWKRHFDGKNDVEFRAILPPAGADWNDLLVSWGRNAQPSFDANRPEYEVLGRLALTSSPQEYSDLWYEWRQVPPGLFEYDGEMFFAALKRVGKEEVLTVARQSNFTCEVNHFALDATNRDRPEYMYNLTVKPKTGRPVSFVASAEDLGQPGQMSKLFLARAKSWWAGERKPSVQLTKRISETRAPVVRQAQRVGYDEDSNCYLFKHFIIKPDGRAELPNDNGFFEVKRREYLRPPSNGVVDRLIKPEHGENDVVSLYTKLCLAWGDKAAVGVAWAVASWFCHLISEILGFMPFLSFHGEPHTGKSSLIQFLQAMQGYDGEGLPMIRANTSKGRIRELAQRSSMFCALLEANAGESARMDFDQFLTLYNLGDLQVRARTTNSLETQTIHFKSTLAFIQNHEAFVSVAMRERVLSIRFDDEALSAHSKAVYDELKTIPRSEWATVLPAVLRHRQSFESKWPDYFNQARRELSGLGNVRLEENHALVLAFHRIFTEVFRIEYDLAPAVRELTKAKIQEVEAKPSGLADFFFDVCFELIRNKDEEAKRCIDWPGLQGIGASREPPAAGQLCFSLNAVMDLYGQFRATVKDLQTALRAHPAYIASNKNHRYAIEPDGTRPTKKSWFFDLAKIPRLDEETEEGADDAEDRPPFE